MISGLLQFGDSQKMRLVRILRSSVMVRVGGGWEPLDKFLEKNDPCRGTSNKAYPLLPVMYYKYAFMYVRVLLVCIHVCACIISMHSCMCVYY